MKKHYEIWQSRIHKHIQMDYLTLIEIQELAELFPQFVIKQICFRACLPHDHGSLLFWSKTKAGCQSYLNNSHRNLNDFIILKAQVKGIDLNDLIIFLNHQVHYKESLNNPYSDEEEVLAISYNII